MAQTLIKLGLPKRFTLTNANEALEVTLPRGCRTVTMHFVANDGKYGVDGVDAAALTNFTTIPSDQPIEKSVNEVEHGIPAVIFVESATALTVVEILPEAK